MEHAFHAGLERPMALYWGVRSRRDLYLPELPRRWADAAPGFRYVPVLSEPDADWDGRTRLRARGRARGSPRHRRLRRLLSGPPVMVEAGRGAFEGVRPGL
jgi:CDP-4-dehydro-6-deoxyglucose reductase